MKNGASWLVVNTIRYSLYLVEAIILVAVFEVALKVPEWGHRTWDAVERRFSALARRRWLAVIVTGLAALAARAALLPLLPIRVPMITDEFSYLLAADTFASGRLTNPAHPMWRHFESMHILQQPTYMSMYHAAQGLILAAGKLAAGHPWWGVYASVAVMCALLCWMLQGWLPPKWALLGGLIAVLRLGLFGYWINSYWGGAAAAIGGLLVLGALPRLMRGNRVGHSVLMAAGMGILANSRPYEGLVLSLAVCALLALWLWRRGQIGRTLLRVALPGIVTLAVVGCGTAYYYRAVTGSPLRMPYQVVRKRYAPARIFLWERPIPIPVYPDAAMRRFYVGWELPQFLEAKTLPGLVKNSLEKAVEFWLFFLGPALALPLIFLPRIVRDRRVRPLVVVCAAGLVGLSLNTWFYPHYVAPFTGALYGVVLQGMRHLRVWRRNVASGLLVARSIPAVCLGMVLLRVCLQPLSLFMPADWPMTWYYTRPGDMRRARVQAWLENQPGLQLAVVHYGANHNPLEEWVYNQASIDSARVVWAREMDQASDEALMRYFRDRRAWLVQADLDPAVVTPYPLRR